jgi:hypothetical protein
MSNQMNCETGNHSSAGPVREDNGYPSRRAVLGTAMGGLAAGTLATFTPRLWAADEASKEPPKLKTINLAWTPVGVCLSPEQIAEVYASYAPNYPKEDVIAMLKSQTHHHNPVGADLKREIALYAEDLKLVSVLKPSTDPVRFAERVYANVLV